jgi:hypothetical protein
VSFHHFNQRVFQQNRPVASLAAAQANVGVQNNSGSRRRMAQTTQLTDAVEKGKMS